MLYGRTNAALSSRFLREIPEDVLLKKGGYQSAPSYYTAPAPKKQQNYQSAYSYSGNSGSYLALNKGDMVQHTAFGRGLVLSVMKMGGDALLEIAFDQIGTKKLMAKTASAHLKKL